MYTQVSPNSYCLGEAGKRARQQNTEFLARKAAQASAAAEDREDKAKAYVNKNDLYGENLDPEIDEEKLKEVRAGQTMRPSHSKRARPHSILELDS